MNEALVIIPTYNELKNLAPIVIRTLASTDAVDVLIVDDNSPDGTGDLADELELQHPRVRVLHRSEKAGLGPAYLAGFEWGLHRGYAALVEMAADGSHHPEDLPRLLDLLENHDLALGSRWVPGGRVENWPIRRRLLSQGGNLYTRVALGISVKDATGGFRAFRAESLRQLDLSQVASHGYCFQVDLLWRALLSGFTVVEMPIVFTERVTGESKMSGPIVRESLARVTQWGLHRRLANLGELLVNHHSLPSLRGQCREVRASG